MSVFRKGTLFLLYQLQNQLALAAVLVPIVASMGLGGRCEQQKIMKKERRGKKTVRFLPTTLYYYDFIFIINYTTANNGKERKIYYH